MIALSFRRCPDQGGHSPLMALRAAPSAATAASMAAKPATMATVYQETAATLRAGALPPPPNWLAPAPSLAQLS